MSDIVERLRSSREWFNQGECCGDKDSEGICAAPACIYGDALKEFYSAADEIEKLRAALREIKRRTQDAHPMSYLGDYWRIAKEALGEKE